MGWRMATSEKAVYESEDHCESGRYRRLISKQKPPTVGAGMYAVMSFVAWRLAN